jgi:hypothetical protein
MRGKMQRGEKIPPPSLNSPLPPLLHSGGMQSTEQNQNQDQNQNQNQEQDESENENEIAMFNNDERAAEVGLLSPEWSETYVRLNNNEKKAVVTCFLMILRLRKKIPLLALSKLHYGLSLLARTSANEIKDKLAAHRCVDDCSVTKEQAETTQLVFSPLCKSVAEGSLSALSAFCNEVRYPQLHILSTKHVFRWLLDHSAEYSLTKLRFLATCHSIPSSVQQKSLAELCDALRSHTCTSLWLSPLGLVEKAGVTFSTFLLSGEVAEEGCSHCSACWEAPGIFQ